MKQFLPCLLALLTLATFTASNAAPSADLWERWTKHDPASTQTINHSGWDQVLSRYLILKKDQINRFAYKAISQDDRNSLKAYLASLGKTQISQYNRAEQRAFWINLYNALTVEVILQHFPINSIRDISFSLFTSGPWKEKLIKVENESLSLDDIEHRILRPIWHDPRIHYAVNCASIGCPNLQAQAFTSHNTEDMLEKATLEFVNHKRAASVSNTGNLRVSSLYKWFADDFGGSDAVLAHLKQYAKPKLSKSLQGVDKIYGDHYDWSLNSLMPMNAGSEIRSGS